jgi:hypothetical protein
MLVNDMFPPNPDLPLLHTRRYEVRAFRMADDRFLLRGVVCDEKPAGVYVSNDPDPLWMHLMVVDLEITYPAFVIEKASVEFKNHPHLGCTDITDHYKKLEGMSISRGFNAKVKELFAGPRGCTHIGALLSAMAPVAIQTGWSMRAFVVTTDADLDSSAAKDQRSRQFLGTINTCHMWAEDGDLVATVKAGGEVEMPLSVSIRLRELGRSLDEWDKFRG